MAKNFKVSLYLSNVLCNKNSSPETISIYKMIKPLTYLMKLNELVNPDITR
jgi:hypothetical protein